MSKMHSSKIVDLQLGLITLSGLITPAPQAMKNILIGLLMLSFISSSTAQARLDLKLYNVFGYFNQRENTPYFIKRDKDFSWTGISPAIKIHKAHSQMNWELAVRYGIAKQRTMASTFKEQDFSIRTEWGKYMKAGFIKNARLQISASARLFVYLSDEVPTAISPGFRITSEAGGISFSVVPHLELPLSEVLFLDINTSLLNFYYGVNFNRVHNPVLTINQQQQGGFELTIWSEYILRIGIGYRLFRKEKEMPSQ